MKKRKRVLTIIVYANSAVEIIPMKESDKFTPPWVNIQFRTPRGSLVRIKDESPYKHQRTVNDD